MIKTELIKKAGVTSEYLATLLAGANPLTAPIAAAGTIGSAVTPTHSKEEQLESSKHDISNFIPGVSSYRLGKRLGRSAEDEGGYLNMLSELGGMGTSSLLAALAANHLGFHPWMGALLSGAHGLGALAALFTPTWDKKRLQEGRGIGTIMADLLVPGVAAYNHMKRLGYTAKAYDEPARLEEVTDRRVDTEFKRLQRDKMLKDLSKD